MKNKKIFLKRLFIFTVFILFFGFYILADKASAAVLYLEPGENEYYQEDIFVVKVKLDTEEEKINAIKMELSFPPEILEVIDISRGDSILSLWPEEPLFSNEKGIVSFIGGIPQGFSGQSKLVSIPFRVISQFDSFVLAEIMFENNSLVLLNDGLGSKAETVFKGSVFNILPERAEIPRDEWKQEMEKDNILPEPFEIILARDPLIFEGKYFIAFSTIDLETGIDYYEIKEGDRPWKRDKSPYLLEDQTLQSIIKVKAVDKAGNERIAELMPPILPEPFYKSFFLWILTILTIILVAVYFLRRKAFWQKKEK